MKRECARFEEEGLVRLEEGLPLSGHFETCPECLRARARYERFANVLRSPAELPRDKRWEQGVWDAIGRRERAPDRPRRPWVAIASAMAAAAAVAIVALRTVPSRSTSPSDVETLAVSVQPVPGGTLRGSTPPDATSMLFAHLGDSLQLDAQSRAPNVEIRLYHEDRELIFRCPPGCERRGGRLTGHVALSKAGTYQPYLVSSDAPLPAPEAMLDDDTKRLLETGARIVLGRSVHVF
jgi:hypothetical protein